MSDSVFELVVNGVRIGGSSVEVEDICTKNPRKWWKEINDVVNGKGFRFYTTNWDSVDVYPVDYEGFYSKYLENLDDSIESPFNCRIEK